MIIWRRFWMRFAGPGRLGRVANRLAALGVPPFYARVELARLGPRGFISPRATLRHPELRLGRHVCIDDDVLLYRDRDGGPIELGDDVHLWRGTIIQTGQGGRVVIGAGTHIQPRSQLSAYTSSIEIGRRVEIAPNCSFYPYDHGMAPGVPIYAQPLKSRGPILIGDHVWLGVGVTVLAGVRIGEGAVIAAGAVVTRDVPPRAIAAGVPARVVKMRAGLLEAERGSASGQAAPARS